MVKRKSALGCRAPTAKRSQASRERQLQVQTLSRHPEAYNYNEQNNTNKTDVGSMSVLCAYCGAHKFNCESPGFCCVSGKVDLPLYL